MDYLIRRGLRTEAAGCTGLGRGRQGPHRMTVPGGGLLVGLNGRSWSCLETIPVAVLRPVGIGAAARSQSVHIPRCRSRPRRPDGIRARDESPLRHVRDEAASTVMRARHWMIASGTARCLTETSGRGAGWHAAGLLQRPTSFCGGCATFGRFHAWPWGLRSLGTRCGGQQSVSAARMRLFRFFACPRSGTCDAHR